MTRDDIIRLALDAHLLNYVDLETPRRYFICADAGVEEVERFAALVAAAEREACAKLCEEVWNTALEEAAKYAEGDGDDVLADSIRGLKK